ncbi:MAG: tRNA (adenosine(37)-N6)-threonylcarbamoyltransferase complex transferase subunit TsaD [Verrucomicrobia bacterium]|nr:tRNA (adenosine(37)-N6)-threonylcarbamoyltransferase complex transferase subunit TsaD [Cytophagales bacterium]
MYNISPTHAILAIESSCDETSAAILINGKIRSNVIANQSIHEQYGGVVPELASRDHQKNIVPVVQTALLEANTSVNELTAIAYTQGPGLLGSLLVGSAFAKSMALGLGVPLISVNHMKAHILAHFIDDPKPKLPFLCLTVSGGHTQLVLVKDYLDMEIIGQTQDDAVGEAFDKTAKLLNLPYPGGPLIDKYAQQGNPKAFAFPIVEMPALNFSFSGIKTNFLYFLKQKTAENPDFITQHLADICASVQYTLVQILMKKLRKAAHHTQINEIAIAGGVSANSLLRQTLQKEGELNGWQTYVPKFEYCTDNAAMIAMAAYFKASAGDFAGADALVDAGLKF